MKRHRKILGFGLVWLLATVGTQAQPSVVTIDVKSHGADITKTMYGVFFEEINHAGDGGLYAELVQNLSFEEATMLPGYTVEKGNRLPRQERQTRRKARRRVVTLAAKSGEDENSFDEPLRIAPRTSMYKKFGREFNYTFKPFSYTILRIKVK